MRSIEAYTRACIVSMACAILRVFAGGLLVCRSKYICAVVKSNLCAKKLVFASTEERFSAPKARTTIRVLEREASCAVLRVYINAAVVGLECSVVEWLCARTYD